MNELLFQKCVRVNEVIRSCYLEIPKRNRSVMIRKVLLLITTAGWLMNAQSMFHGDAAHTGTAAGAGPTGPVSMKWKFDTGGRIFSSPVRGGDSIYIGTWDGRLCAIDAKSGKEIWKFQSNGPVDSTPAVDSQTVYFGSYDGFFYAVDAKSGKELWKFATPGERRFEARHMNGVNPSTQTMADSWDFWQSSPVVAAGKVFFGSGDNNVYALDAHSGKLLWMWRTGDVVHSSPAYRDGVLYVGSFDSVLLALEADTGKLKWYFQAGSDPYNHNQVGFQGSPTVVDGTVYIGCRDSNFYAIDAATGKQRWHFNNNGSWVTVTPAVVGGKVFFGTSDSLKFYSFDAATGKQLFEVPLKMNEFSSPTIAANVAYFGLINGSLLAVNATSGKLLWEWHTAASQADPEHALLSDGKLNEKSVFKSMFLDGMAEAVYRITALGSIVSTPLVSDGVIYVGSTDGFLYALQ